jgi:hypothetical protein
MFMGLTELGELAFVEVVVLLNPVFCNNVVTGLLAFVEVVVLLNPEFCNNVVTGLLGLRPRLNVVDIL